MIRASYLQVYLCKLIEMAVFTF